MKKRITARNLGLSSFLRNNLKRVTPIRRCYYLFCSHIHSIKFYFLLRRLRQSKKVALEENAAPQLIVSLTSFPARIHDVWITIESIFWQDVKPCKVILVLSIDEFPLRSIPDTLIDQCSRGLEILWVEGNLRSYNKLIPVRRAYPDAQIITIDDDIIYEPWRIAQLMFASNTHQNAIIGHRGWHVAVEDGCLLPYSSWQPIEKKMSGNKVFLTGVGAILYPPSVMDESLLFDMDTALSLSTLADDVWFWAVAVKSNCEIICLGNRHVFQIKFGYSDLALSYHNVALGANDIYLMQVSDKYSLGSRLITSK